MSSTKEPIAAWKTAQVNGLLPWCPRCGRDTMTPDLLTNALSRKADIMICDECGTK